MKNKALAFGLTALLSLPGVAGAAAVTYDGGRLSDKDGPHFQEPLQSLDEVEAEARQRESINRLQDQPDAKTEEILKAGRETSKEAEKREKEHRTVDTESTLPITIYGDQVEYNSETGNFYAKGNVRLYQGNQRLYTAQAQGNSKTGDVYLLTGGRVIQDTGTGQSVTDGQWGHYNFLDKTGTVKNISGVSGDDIYHADIGEIYPDRVELTSGGRTTRCPAVKHPPCVEIKADKVVIYPKDKIIAYNVKVFVKGKHIYSRDRWINRFFDGEEKHSLLPHIGHDSDHGWEISYDLDVPLSPNNSFNADLKYYSKIGWRPMFRDIQDERNFYVQIQDGHDEDSDNHWIRKYHDIKLGIKSHKFWDKLPLNYSGYISHGLWKDDWRKSWHTEYAGFITHDPIRLTHEKNPLYLNLGAGSKWTKESLRGTTVQTPLYTATLNKSFDGGWNTWLGYYYEKAHSSVFEYSNPDMKEEIQWGLSKQIDHNNWVNFTLRYDKEASRVYEYIYRWYHDFCCFRLGLEYRQKKYNGEHEWSVTYDLYRW